MAYYEKVKEDLMKLKKNDNERKQGKKDTNFIENDVTRRSTYSRRSTSLKIAVMHSSIDVIICSVMFSFFLEVAEHVSFLYFDLSFCCQKLSSFQPYLTFGIY